MAAAEEDPRAKALEEYKRKLLQHKEVDSKVRALREDVKTAKKEYDKTEDDLKALQSVGQIIGEVLKQLDAERCMRGRGGRGAAAPVRAAHRARACLPAAPVPRARTRAHAHRHCQGVERAAVRGRLPPQD